MFDLWIKALSGPSEENYELILKENEPNGGTAALWILVAAVVSGVLQGIRFLIFGSPELEGADLPFSTGFLVLIGFVGTPIFTFLAFYISAGLVFIGAKIFKGQGDFGEQTFMQAVGIAPLTIISTALGLIPLFGGALAGLVSLFSLYVNILAIKVTHRFGWGQAIAAVILPAIVLGVFLCCCLFGFITLLAPEIGNVLEEIQSELQP